jgi:aspartyl aminopeptidase
LNELAINAGVNPRIMFANSKCLSADVNACFDPNFAEAYEARNAAFINKGVVVTKFTGSGGKSSTNDASAEYVAEIRKIFNEANVLWQTAELGKVDAGGGGTIAYILSLYGMQVVDCGVALHSMHAPWETLSKADLFEAYKGYKAFLIEC